MQYLISIVLLLFGIAVILYTPLVVRIFGRMDWAEHWMGPTGTYGAWKIIGVLCIVGSVVILRYA